VNARVRGLGGHLLPTEAFAHLAAAGSLVELGRELVARGILEEEPAAITAPELALAIRRAAAREVRVLRRWLGAREAVLAVAIDEEDRRNLRALIRGAAEGAPAEARLLGLIPTPTLPERLLREVAGQARIRNQATLLVAAGHHAGAAILAAAAGAEPDLFRIELAIARSFAERAVRGARQGGGFLRDYVAAAIDRENCRTALILAAVRGVEEPVAPAFLPGGRLDSEEFLRAATADDAEAAARLLGATRAARDLGPLLQRHAHSPAALQAALEERVLVALRREARLDPLGPATVLLFLRRLRAQTVALGRILWGLDLNAPARVRLADPVEAR
jgi:vacuolar-type H+-ATPase subunit C/Vma6